MWKRLKDYIKRWRQQTIKLHNYQKVAQFRIRDYHCSLFRLNQRVCVGAIESWDRIWWRWCAQESEREKLKQIVVCREKKTASAPKLNWDESFLVPEIRIWDVFSSLKFLENGRVILVSYRNTHLWVFVSLPSLIQTRPFHFPHSIL